MDVTELCELSSETNGAKILFASNDFFGVAENLIKEAELNSDTVKMTNKMDAWLTKRRPKYINDFVIIKLAASAEIHFICIDTTSLFEDVALIFSVQATKLWEIGNEIFQDRSNRVGKRSNVNEWYRIRRLQSQKWPTLISWQFLNPGYPAMNKRFFMIPSTEQDYTHLRFNIFPDGGISRLRVYGKVLIPIPKPIPRDWRIDLVSKIYGGNCIAYSSCYNNTHPNNLIKPSESISKKDGWQTARSPSRATVHFSHNSGSLNIDQIIGEEWAIFQLGCIGTIDSIVLDLKYCEGNNPYVVRVQGLEESIRINNRLDINNKLWQNIIPYTLMNDEPHQRFRSRNYKIKMAYVKLSMKPDGCVSRFRVFGYKEN